ncbi:hypothetical protein [Nostoc sp. NZL]|uniref:hypothetical protein n=1 Tax=Nostoc sp. NZL TaxID=2650612 RepID=UPI0018C6F749|nr:hypothetical protein [Nostoc sp. NZL]MBG1240555.1 hypothetical protein [Nostoc sp. NZL]
MIGELFTTGVSIKQQYPGDENKWIAVIRYEDESHANLHGVQGTLQNKYGDDLLNAIKTVLADSEKMGIKMMTLPNSNPSLYVKDLFVNNQETWEQINLAADALNFEVMNCLDK